MRRSVAALHRALAEVNHIIIAPWPPVVLWFLVIAIMGGVAPLVQIWATMELINRLTLHLTAPMRSAASLLDVLVPYLPWIGGLVGASMLSFIAVNNIFQPYLAAQHTERIVAYWSRRLLEKASALRLEHFERPTYYDLLQRARAALNTDMIANQHTQFQRILARTAGCVSILWAFSTVHWSLALLLAGGSVAVTRWRIARSRDMVKLRQQQTPQQRRQDYWRGLVTQRTAAAEVRLFDLGAYIIDHWRALSNQQLHALTAVRRGNFQRELPVTIAHTALYSVIGFGLILASVRGSIGIGTLVALLFALQQYLDLMQNFTRLDRLHQVMSELTSVSSFVALGDEEGATGELAPRLTTEGIRFEQVSFTYPGSDRAVLDRIDFQLRPGERIALVGENGAGKTTLTRLLLGLYQPTQGRVTIEGTDLRSLHPIAWRQSVAAVFQDFTRYALSVRENIGFGRLDQLDNDAAIMAAAAKSGVAEVIDRFPQQYMTVLGKEFADGVDLSGGQWQQLAIARAYLRNAPVVVLDEPAAALDARAEHQLYQQFLTLSAGKTVLLISHRLGSARLADRIVFLQHGRIAQMGTHDELLRCGGPYADLYHLQAAWYQEDADAPTPLA